MPLDKFQTEIAKAIAGNRSPRSTVAGGAALQQHGVRLSGDIDIFLADGDQVATDADKDIKTLEQAGFTVEALREREGFREVAVSRDEDGSTRLQWVQADRYHYFSPVQDPAFGWRLSFLDLAVNKTLACASRREPRDAIDLRFILSTGVPLWQLVAGVCGKSSEFTPEGALRAISRNTHYSRRELVDAGILADGVDPTASMERLQDRLQTAERQHQGMPAGMATGLLLNFSEELLRTPPKNGEKFIKLEPHPGPIWPRGAGLDAMLIQRITRSYGQTGEKLWRNPANESELATIRTFIEESDTIGPNAQGDGLTCRWRGIDADETQRRRSIMRRHLSESRIILDEVWRMRDPKGHEEWRRSIEKEEDTPVLSKGVTR